MRKQVERKSVKPGQQFFYCKDAAFSFTAVYVAATAGQETEIINGNEFCWHYLPIMATTDKMLASTPVWIEGN